MQHAYSQLHKRNLFGYSFTITKINQIGIVIKARFLVVLDYVRKALFVICFNSSEQHI